MSTSAEIRERELQLCLQGWGFRYLDQDSRALMTSRNRTLVCEDERGERVLVKVGEGRDRSGVIKEGIVLRALEAQLAGALSLARLRQHDAERSVLAVEWLAGTETLYQRQRHTRADLELKACALGRAIGHLHEGTRDAQQRFLPLLAEYRPARPLGFFVRLSPRVFGTLSPTGIQFFAYLQERPAALRSLQQLSEPFEGSAALLHGDLKLANVLCWDEGPTDRVALIDWELAEWGEPAKDLGGLVCDYGLDWMAPLREEHALELSRLQETLRGLLRSYREARGAGFPNEPDFASRVIRWAGAILMFYVYGLAQSDGDFGRRARGLADFAVSWLTVPQTWEQKLLGDWR